MVVSTFLVLDKDGRERFFEENFLLADVKPDIVLGMPSLTMGNADIDFRLGTYNEDPTPPETYF